MVKESQKGKLRKLIDEHTNKFKECSNPRPVVLARGLWENLFSWESFGFEIARGEGLSLRKASPRDVWLIEITGGPNTECDTCPNYNFSELTDYYWPALIAGVQAYSNQSNITYIGFSNGCRVALRSLEKYQNTGKSNVGYYNNGSDWVLTNLTAKPKVVDTFVAVGCPGIFLGNSPFIQIANDNGNAITGNLRNRNHVSSVDVGRASLQSCNEYSPIFDPILRASCRTISTRLAGEGGGNISFNLLNEYINWIVNGNGSQVGTGVTINNFMAIYGTLPTGLNLVASGNSDGVVSMDDIESIDGTINVSNNHRRIQRIRNVFHTSNTEEDSLPDNQETRRIIQDYINEVN